MSDLRIENSDYVTYVLQRGEEASIRMDRAPEGWDEDALEIVRNNKYHGILTQFTDSLVFRGREKEFINEAFDLDGHNAKLYLIRFQLRENHSYVIGDDVTKVKFREMYRGVADWDTKSEKGGGLSINFNSQELDKLIDSFRSDDLSIGRDFDLENNRIRQMKYNKVHLGGRALEAKGWSENRVDVVSGQFGNQFDYSSRGFTIPTEFGVKGFDRHIQVDNILLPREQDSLDYQPNFFYNDIEDSVRLETNLKINLRYNIRPFSTSQSGYTPTIVPKLYHYKFNAETNKYDYYQTEWTGPTITNGEWTSFSGHIKTFEFGELENESGLLLMFNIVNAGELLTGFTCDIEEFKITVEEKSKFETEETYNFSFVNEVGTRLMEIISGREKTFYSKAFGRSTKAFGRSTPNNREGFQDYDYSEDGEWGHIGLIHGFDIRRFVRTNELYKHMEISFRDFIDSLVSTFNVGVGVEESIFGQRVRVEKISHFYQGRRVVRLPYQAINVERSFDAKMFNSSGSFGGSKGGNYEHGLGLDEPNAKSDYIFPLRNTSNKYTEVSSIRSDDTGMELIRRQPAWLDDTKDTSSDPHIWYLDLKENESGVYEQLHWSDALVRPPIGISDPESYRSWRFTPKRAMFRHGSIIRAGMEQKKNLERYITLGSSKSNINLETEYLPGVAPSEKLGPVSESSAEKAFRLDNALITPEVIKFTHPVDDDLMDWLLGTTELIIGGEVEQVPNWYFKVEFLNENEEYETGYIISMKPRNGEFLLQKANESMLGTTLISEEDLCFTTQAAFSKPITIKVGGTGYIDWNDGTPNTSFNGREVEINKFVDGIFDGTIDFYGTVTLLYFEEETANFTHSIDDLPDTIEEYVNYGLNMCDGDIKNLPIRMTRFEITGWNSITGDIEDLPVGIVILSLEGFNTVYGNISEAGNVRRASVWIVRGHNTANQYTAGVSFNPEIYTFWHEPQTGNGLTSESVDNIIIDLYNSGMHRGMVFLQGSNEPRTSASDYEAQELIARGVNLQTN